MSGKDILIVSLDIHKNTHYAHFELMSNAQKVGKDFSFPNSSEGFKTFFSEVERRTLLSNSSPAFVLEPTGPYWKPLGYTILKHSFPLYIVSPEQTFHQRIADDPSSSKLDHLDPLTIAKIFRDGKARKARLPQSPFKELRTLHREYLSLTKKLAREKIQLRSILAEANPELSSFFSNLFSKIPFAILSSFPTPEQIVELGINGLTTLFKNNGNKIFGRRKAEKLFNLMKSSIAVPDKSAPHLIRRTIQRISLLRAQIEEVSSSILSLASPLAQKLTVIDGIDIRSACRFIAELGDINSIDSSKALVKLAGLSPKEFISGSSIHKKAIISKKGNPYLRTIAYYMALRCIKRNSRLSAYYKHLLSKGKAKMVAICAVARKLLCIIFHVLKGESYEPEKIGTGLRK